MNNNNRKQYTGLDICLKPFIYLEFHTHSEPYIYILIVNFIYFVIYGPYGNYIYLMFIIYHCANILCNINNECENVFKNVFNLKSS